MKKNRKKKERLEEEVPPIPFQDDSPFTFYKYRCQDCNYSEEVEDFIVDEFGMDVETDTWSMPSIACPECGGFMFYVDNEKAKE